MPLSRCLIVMVFAAFAMVGCSKQFMCDLNGTQCGPGKQQATEANIADLGQSCDGATCANSYCSPQTHVCTEFKPKGAACESSIECSGHCAQTTDDPGPVCQ